MPSLVRAIVGLTAGLILVAGCTGPAATSSTTAGAPATAASSAATAGSGASDQSVLEACNALSTAMEEAATTLETAGSELGSDPTKALKAFQDFSATFEAAVAKVTNPKVRAQGDKAVAATKELTDTLGQVINDPTKATKMTAALQKFQEEITAVGTVCSG